MQKSGKTAPSKTAYILPKNALQKRLYFIQKTPPENRRKNVILSPSKNNKNQLKITVKNHTEKTEKSPAKLPLKITPKVQKNTYKCKPKSDLKIG